MLAASLLVGCGSVEQPSDDRIAATVTITPKSARMWVSGQRTSPWMSSRKLGPMGRHFRAVGRARPTLLAVSQSGVAKTLRKGDSTWVVATVGQVSDSAFVEVGTTPCGTLAHTVFDVGQVKTDIPASGFCVAYATGAEYALIAFDSSLVSSSSAALRSRASASRRR